MKENETASVEIEKTRSAYLTTAERGALLYFVIQDLAGIDSMYQYSLTYFLKLFNLIIE
jgi:dynein heavy chain